MKNCRKKSLAEERLRTAAEIQEEFEDRKKDKKKIEKRKAERER